MLRPAMQGELHPGSAAHIDCAATCPVRNEPSLDEGEGNAVASDVERPQLFGHCLGKPDEASFGL